MIRYNTLLMDADETLLDFRRSEGYALERTLKAHGVTMTTAIHDDYHAINGTLWKQLETGAITRERLKLERFERLFESVGLRGTDAAAFNAAYMETLGGTGFLLDGALELLQALSASFRICLITNGTASVQHTRLQHSGILPFLSDVFISEEIGADKPSEIFFERVLKALGDPDKSELLVIGDSLTSDIDGGNRIGIDTCWYNPFRAAHPAHITPTVQVASFDELRALLLA